MIEVTPAIFHKLVEKLIELDGKHSEQMTAMVELAEQNKRLSMLVAADEAKRLGWQIEGFIVALDILGITKLVSNERHGLETDVTQVNLEAEG